MKKVKNKQKTILFFLITFLFSITIGLLPSPIITPRVSAENLDESKSTYKDIKTLSATAYRCLEEDILDMEGRDIKAFKDIFHNRNYALGGGVLGVNQSINGYDAERAVVGFVVDPSNGVQTCKTVLDRSLKILDRESGSNGVAKALVNTTDFGNPIPRARLKTRAGELRGDIIKKMSALKKSMSSAHYRYWSYYDSLSPDGSLANTCYQVGGQSPTGSFNSSRDIELEGENGTSHVLYYRGDEKKAGGEDKISDRAYKDTGWLVDNGGVAATTTIGDIFVRLGGKKEGVGGGHPNYWSTPFFPWSMTSSDNADDETEGLISCSLVKTHLEDVGAEFLTVKKGQILLTPKPITSPENAVTIDKALKDKQDDIKPLLEANPDIMYFCTGSIRDKYANELGTSLRNEASTIDYFTKWLAAYGTTTVVSVPWTLDEGKKMVECLVNDNAYGDELFTIMKRETEGLQDVDPTAADKKPAADEPQNCKGGVGTIDAALGWFICPVVDMIFGVIHFLETNFIIPYLAVSPLVADDSNAIYNLWKGVRNISYIFLMMAFLFLIFSETTSFGGEAYQIKRLAPRLLVVAIAMTLSFYLVGWAIDFFNVLGVGIAQLTKWAIQQTGSEALVNIEGGAVGLMAFLGSTGALTVGALLLGGTAAPFLLVTAATGFIILLGVVVTIVLRQVVIIGLVIISPLALVSALLPNTEKLFRTWWSYLTKALVMYPLIVLLFAAGKIGGALLSSGAAGGAGVGDTAIKSIMTFVAGVIPLVLVPQTFKLAGGAMAGTYGMMRGMAGKAREGMMGSDQDPLSLKNKMRDKSRSRRAGASNAALGAFSGSGVTRGGRDRSTHGVLGRRRRGGAPAAFRRKAGVKVDKALGVSERYARIGKAGLSRYEALMEDDADIATVAAYGGVEASGDNMNALYSGGQLPADDTRDHNNTTKKAKPGQETAVGAMGSDAEAQIELAKMMGAKNGNSLAAAQKYAYSLNQRVEDKALKPHEADMLWEKYAVAAKNNGGKSIGKLKGADGTMRTAWRAREDDQGRLMEPIAIARAELMGDKAVLSEVTSKMAEDGGMDRNASQIDTEAVHQLLTISGGGSAAAMSRARRDLAAAQAADVPDAAVIAAAQSSLAAATNAAAADTAVMDPYDAANLEAVAVKFETTTNWRTGQDKGQVKSIEAFLNDYHLASQAGIVNPVESRASGRSSQDDPDHHDPDPAGNP